MTEGQKTGGPRLAEDKRGISSRSLVLGLLLVAAVCVIVSYAELVLMSIQIGFLQMPPAVIGIFFFMVLFNNALRALGSRLGLTPTELLMIYCMMVVAAMISSRGVMEKVLPLLVTPNYYHNQANRWHELFDAHIKKWMVAYDPSGAPQQKVAVRFFERLWSGETIPWELWIVPLAAWGLLVLLVIFVLLCLASILRRQWVDNEKLPFPLVQLPMELARGSSGQPLLKNPLMWGGALLPAAVFTINGLHNMFPSVPQLTLSVFLNTYMPNPPWNSIYWFSIYLSFAAVGFFFLLPSELLFSLWFFALFARAQDVVAASLGYEIELMPVYGTHLFVAYQTAGAYFVLAGYLLWVARPHLKRVFAGAFSRGPADDAQELLSYRFAVWGLFGGLALIIGWCVLAGMSVWVAMLQFFVFIFIIAIVMARSTAEAGMLMTETSFRPMDLYRMFGTSAGLGPANLTMLGFMDAAFLRDQRGLLLTGFLDGLKISDGADAPRKSFRRVFAIAVVSSLLIAGAIQLWLPYTQGGMSLYSYAYNGNNYWSMKNIENQMIENLPPVVAGRVWFAVGVAFTLLLSYLRAAFYWWPLHPLGYALCVSWTMSVFWFSCLIAWLLKTAIIRYGGMRLYIKARPWFLGMVLGEFGMAVVWALVAGVTGAVPPTFPWP